MYSLCILVAKMAPVCDKGEFQTSEFTSTLCAGELVKNPYAPPVHHN